MYCNPPLTGIVTPGAWAGEPASVPPYHGPAGHELGGDAELRGALQMAVELSRPRRGQSLLSLSHDVEPALFRRRQDVFRQPARHGVGLDDAQRLCLFLV